ncbi:dTDP-4-dehydrorhamnose 3,5-epimerase family protein [Streptomyces sp. NPDC004237]|uniref:dTDP-4-dehydrorhamnose 3,5-epimerase family protein n=1 Tax=Streptomyces sp. NPDC004237 TaxID=3154455 RepID=UPI0033AB9DF8
MKGPGPTRPRRSPPQWRSPRYSLRVVPLGRAKDVTCVGGAVMDVVVDIRIGSPAFGK